MKIRITRIIAIVLLIILSVTLINGGIRKKGDLQTKRKGTMICLECIGIG